MRGVFDHSIDRLPLFWLLYFYFLSHLSVVPLSTLSCDVNIQVLSSKDTDGHKQTKTSNSIIQENVLIPSLNQ